jgi:hypothetical protein
MANAAWVGRRRAPSLTPTQLRLGRCATKPAYPSPIEGEETPHLPSSLRAEGEATQSELNRPRSLRRLAMTNGERNREGSAA